MRIFGSWKWIIYHFITWIEYLFSFCQVNVISKNFLWLFSFLQPFSHSNIAIFWFWFSYRSLLRRLRVTYNYVSTWKCHCTCTCTWHVHETEIFLKICTYVSIEWNHTNGIRYIMLNSNDYWTDVHQWFHFKIQTHSSQWRELDEHHKNWLTQNSDIE